MSAASTIQLLETGLPNSNQGRFVRPTKRIEWNGLVFSTESELQLAQALDRANLFFLPATSCRITAEPGIRETRELDFMIVHRGIPIVVELDGRPHEGRAAEDHRRDRGIKRSGIWLIERFASVEALQDPERIVRTIKGMVGFYRKTA